MSIFGYDPLKYYDGRGAFESLGAGIDMQAGMIGFKSNFAYYDEDTNVIVRRRVDRAFPKWGIELCDAIDGIKIPGFPENTVTCKYATEHRCGLCIGGPNLSSLITGTDPLYDNKAKI